MTELIISSFFAGVLTILAPCVLPVLPIIIGGSVAQQDRWRPYIIIGALVFAVVAFTILLKVSTILIGVSPDFLKYLSASLLLLIGLSMLFPFQWQLIAHKIGLGNSADQFLTESSKVGGRGGAILSGLALGPVFTSCSPTYGLIIAAVFPKSFFEGLILLTSYAIGLALFMLIVALLGQKIISKVKWATNPTGWFRRFLGLLFILIAVVISFGLDKKFEAYILQSGYYDNILQIDQGLGKSLQN